MTNITPHNVDTVKLHATDDAAIWAHEFMAVIAGTPNFDEGSMIAWFANAIETAKDIQRRNFADNLRAMCDDIHARNRTAGWWTNLKTGETLDRNVGELLMLIVSEVAEGMEGHRKNLMDDKLPHRPMLEVELADAFIRIADLIGGRRLDLGGAVVEKLEYNARREDHKIENRVKDDGKKY